MQQANEKNGQAGLILLLILMIVFGIYQIFIVPILNKEDDKESNSNEHVETEEEKINRLGNTFYNVFALDYEDESILTAEDKNYLSERLSLYRMSDAVKLYLGFKNLDPKYVTTDNGYSIKDAVKNSNGNYYYSGKYIMVGALEDSYKAIFGDVPINHGTITLTNKRYVYNEATNRYEIWGVKKETESQVKKITYKEISNSADELYITEYVAYTDYTNPENLVTRTNHNDALEVVITDENVKDYLRYMDKYRYIFKKQEDGNYSFEAVEYVID